jgi:hypothetical protein
MSWNYLENKTTNSRGAHVAEAQERVAEPEVKEEPLEIWRVTHVEENSN